MREYNAFDKVPIALFWRQKRRQFFDVVEWLDQLIQGYIHPMTMSCPHVKNTVS
jgi:hypothetical protein